MGEAENNPVALPIVPLKGEVLIVKVLDDPGMLGVTWRLCLRRQASTSTRST